MSVVENILWTEKYRPAHINDVIVPERIRTILQQGLTQNLLLHGSPGIGKTTTAKAVCKTFNHEYLYINGSSETGVDIIRTKITDFISNQSLGVLDINSSTVRPKIKVVLIDEADMMSTQAFGALRATIESFASVARFILTCNYVEKIPTPIMSRLTQINFDFSNDESIDVKKQYVKRIIQICEQEGLSIDVQAAAKMVKLFFPDFRTIISRLQQFKLEGKTSIAEEDIKEFDVKETQLYDLIFNNEDPIENYKFVRANYQNNAEDCMKLLCSNFCDYVIKEKPVYAFAFPRFIRVLSKYQAEMKHAINPVITLLACIFDLQEITTNMK